MGLSLQASTIGICDTQPPQKTCAIAVKTTTAQFVNCRATVSPALHGGEPGGLVSQMKEKKKKAMRRVNMNTMATDDDNDCYRAI
jgi:hypothetical protein